MTRILTVFKENLGKYKGKRTSRESTFILFLILTADAWILIGSCFYTYFILTYSNEAVAENEITDDISELSLELEEKDDDKPQLVIGILLIICMVSGILAALVPPFAVFLFAALSYLSLLGFFSEEMEELHEKAECKLRARFLRK